MRRVTICLIVLSALALAVFTMPMSAQHQEYPSPDYPFPGFPPELSPLRTSRPAKPQRPLTPATKFVKASNPIPNQYIVVLKDDVVDDAASLSVRRAAVKAIANAHAQAHLGKIGFIYETALKGYSIELPNEAAAVALSNNPKVSWVEEEAQGRLDDGGSQTEAIQTTPPWGLDAIDGSIPLPSPDANGRTNGSYIYNATGSYVTAYVLDTGINTVHQDFSTGFYSRASQAADCIHWANCQSGAVSPYTDVCIDPYPNATNNDCQGHGTHVAGTIGGNTYGAAKGVNIRSVKVATVNAVPLSAVIAGVNWVTSDHLANPSIPVVVNMSLGFPAITSLDNAVSDSIAAGLTYVVAAGNDNGDAQNLSPQRVPAALTVGAVDWTGTRWLNGPYQGSDWGQSVDLFAPGVRVVSAVSGNGLCQYWDGTNTSTCIDSGTSFASPHVAGAVALYLQGRTGTSICGSYPIQGAAPSFGEFSTCPDRVSRFINANANLNRLSNINGTVYDQNGYPIGTVPSPNRFLWTVAIPTRANPIDNERFFVWQQYADFLAGQPQPDEGGLDWWTNEIIGHGHCSAGVNDTSPCTDVWRVLTSRAFWLASHGDLFASNYGLRSGMNGNFVTLCYQIYLRRNPDSGGYNYWLNELSSNYGNPASPDGVFHLIDAFIRSGPPDGYRRRFGP